MQWHDWLALFGQYMLLSLLSISGAGLTFVNPGLLAGETTASLSLTLPDGSTVNSPPVVSTTLLNGSFETPAVSGYAYNPSGASWTFVNGSAIQANGSAWQAAAATDGIQTAVLQGSPGNLGAIEQTLTLSAGTYTLRFKAARRSGQVQPVRFSVDGNQVGGLITPTGNAFADYASGDFIVTAGNHTLRLVATDGSDDRSTFIDQVSLSAGGSPNGLPAGWTAQDIGAVAAAGVTTQQDGVWTRRASSPLATPIPGPRPG